VVFKDEQEFFDFNRAAIVSKHSFKQCPEMYTRFLESLFESQTYPNENESDPLGVDVSISVHQASSFILKLKFRMRSNEREENSLDDRSRNTPTDSVRC
jgi:hypothetical protein